MKHFPPRLTRFRIAISTVFIAAGVSFFLPQPTQGGSIFDDDFVPPTRSTPTSPTPRPQPTPTPAPTPTPPTEAKPEPTPPVPDDASATPKPTPVVPAVPTETTTLVARRAVPSSPEQAKCRKLLKEAFADQLKDRTAPARRKLTKVLLDEAAKTQETPVDYFVLLTGALESAEESGSLGRSFIVIDELAKAYDVDEWAIKADAVTKVWSAGRASVGSVGNVQAAFDVVEQLVADDDFAAAGRIESLLQHGIGGIVDADLKSAVSTHIKTFEATRIEHDRLPLVLEKLKKSPDDPVANTTVGSYLCFTRGQWERGLRFLAKGDNPAVKTLAAAELARSTDAETMAKLADDWWDASTKMSAMAKTKTQIHAASIYRTAMANLSGLRRLAIEKRIADVPSTDSPRRIDLLDMVDPVADAVDGQWQVQDSVLSCVQKNLARVQFPYVPPSEYDFRISYTFVQGNDGLVQICAHGDRQFLWVLGNGNNTLCGFDTIDGKGDNENPTKKVSKAWHLKGQHYTSVVKVRASGVEAYVNGHLISSWKTDFKDMGMGGGWNLKRPDVVGVGIINCFVKFDCVELVEISGQGKSLRNPPIQSPSK